MSRILFHLIPFLLPFVFYAGYIYWRKKAPDAEDHMHDTPWYWLISAGMGLSIAMLALLWVYGSSPPGGEYQPAKMIDGKIVRGNIKP